MVVQECQPALGFALVPAALELFEIAGDGRFGDLEADRKQLAVDTWCSPAGIFRLQPPNEQANLYTDLGPPRWPGLPTPKQAEASTVPGHHCFGLTKMRALAEPEYQRRSATQNSRSRRLSLGRGRLRLKTASCWRKATDSNASQWRGKKNARMYAIIGASKLIALIIVRRLESELSQLSASVF